MPLTKECTTDSLEENAYLFLSNKLRKIVPPQNLWASKEVCPSADKVHGSAERRALVAWEQSGRRKPRLSGFSPSVRKQRPEISNACAALACRHRLREVEISQTVFANLFLSCLHAWIFTCAFCATHWEGIHTDFHSIFTTTLGCTLSHNLFDVSEFNYFNGYFWYLKDIFI